MGRRQSVSYPGETAHFHLGTIMITSFALLAALTIGADEERSNLAIPPEPVSTEQDSYSRSSEELERLVVRPVIRNETVTRLRVSSTSAHGGPEQESTPEFDEVVSYDDCDCCYSSAPRGMFGFHSRFQPSPCYSPGNMPQHFPYVAQPKNYYYLRPYNWFHIPDHQNEVTLYGGDPRHPYANNLFKEIYEEIEAQPAAVESGN